MKKAVALITAVLTAIVLLSGASGVRAQTVEGLQIRPSDSAEADRVRIWAAAENKTNCRMNIQILNDSNRVVRHYIDFLAAPGYYNFFWDKRDDSGARVPEGKYRAKVECCLKVDYENLTVQYSQWERQSELLPADPAQPFGVGLKLEGAAFVVKAELLDTRGRSLEVLVKDTTVGSGTHQFPCVPASAPKRGNYVVRVTVGDAEYRREVTYIP